MSNLHVDWIVPNGRRALAVASMVHCAATGVAPQGVAAVWHSGRRAARAGPCAADGPKANGQGRGCRI